MRIVERSEITCEWCPEPIASGQYVLDSDGRTWHVACLESAADFALKVVAERNSEAEPGLRPPAPQEWYVLLDGRTGKLAVTPGRDLDVGVFASDMDAEAALEKWWSERDGDDSQVMALNAAVGVEIVPSVPAMAADVPLSDPSVKGDPVVTVAFRAAADIEAGDDPGLTDGKSEENGSGPIQAENTPGPYTLAGGLGEGHREEDREGKLQCRKCGAWKLADRDHFCDRKGHIYDLCRTCRSEIASTAGTKGGGITKARAEATRRHIQERREEASEPSPSPDAGIDGKAPESGGIGSLEGARADSPVLTREEPEFPSRGQNGESEPIDDAPIHVRYRRRWHALGMTVDAVAHRSSVPSGTLKAWQWGEGTLKPPELRRLEAALASVEERAEDREYVEAAAGGPTGDAIDGWNRYTSGPVARAKLG